MFAWLFGLLLVLPPAAPPSDPALTPILPLVLQGDLVEGLGNVTSIAAVTVNDAGSWLVEVETDHPDPARNGALLLDGAILLREGDALPAPAGSTVAGFGPIAAALTGDGVLALDLRLGGAVGFDDDSGLFLGTTLIAQEGSLVGAAGLSPGTIWKAFSAVHHNDARQVLVMATVDDPLLSSSFDRALLRLDLDAAGQILAITSLVAEGDLLPGQSEVVADLETDVHAFALSSDGRALYIVDLTGNPFTDQALYLDDELLAQEGSPSPVPGRAWASLASAECSLASGGRWVLSARLAGDAASDALLVKDGAKFMQKGDAPEFLGGFHLTDFGSSGSSGPVLRGENDALLWSARWNDPTPGRGKGLLLDERVLVETGVSQVGGQLVADVFAVTEGYVLSRGGRYVAFRGRLEDGRQGAFLIDTYPWTDLGHGLAGTAGRTPSLVGEGTLFGGTLITLKLSHVLPHAAAHFILGFTPFYGPFMGGTMVPDTHVVVPGLPLDAQGRLEVNLPFPPGAPPGIPLWWQFWISDPGGPKGFAASNALQSVTP